MNLYREFQCIGNFKVAQYFVIIVELHFQWLEFHIKIHCMTGKQCAFTAREKSLFSETLAGTSTLTQSTPCLINILSLSEFISKASPESLIILHDKICKRCSLLLQSTDQYLVCSRAVMCRYFGT